MDHRYERLYDRVMSYNIDEPAARLSFHARLANENGWSSNYARRVVEEYKKFAFLAVAAGHPVTPSDQVDQAWHLHLTYTRSYWERFCGEVLERPLHHQPTTGGPAEQAKFIDWYKRTLASYRRLFNQEPPPEIWPDARTRFGRDLKFRRVNTLRNWIIAKPPLPWAVVAAVGIPLAVLLAGCVSENGSQASRSVISAAMFDPFRLPGSDFLVLFVAVFVAAFTVAAYIRWRMRGNGAEYGSESAQLDPYELVYLAGGERAVMYAALASLFSRGMLQMHSGARLARSDRDGPAEKLHEVERDVLEAVDPDFGTWLAELDCHWPACGPIERRLTSLGLIVTRPRAQLGRALPLMTMSVVPLLGAIKLVNGLATGRPVELLFIACVFSVILAWSIFGRRLHRTHLGDQVLRQTKQECETAMLKSGCKALHKLSGTDLAVATGLFGIDILADGSYDELHAALKPQSGFDFSIGVGCDGGGCGGGGCGGCGGCGG